MYRGGLSIWGLCNRCYLLQVGNNTHGVFACLPDRMNLLNSLRPYSRGSEFKIFLLFLRLAKKLHVFQFQNEFFRLI